MVKLVAEKAAEAAEISLLEKDQEYHEENKRSRKQRARREDLNSEVNAVFKSVIWY